MFQQEAEWLYDVLYGGSTTRHFPLLNVGSSTEAFRRVTQPWIDGRLFSPARARGMEVFHQDLKDDVGVDVVGDLVDPDVVGRISRLGIRAILCSNVLEHVAERRPFCMALSTLLPAGGRLIVTVPHRYPFHGDPIDTMFRPTLAELEAEFPTLRRVSGAVVDCGWYAGRNARQPLLAAAKRFARLAVPFYEPFHWRRAVRDCHWLFRRISQSCLLLERPS